jgi:hypothetical protein
MIWMQIIQLDEPICLQRPEHFRFPQNGMLQNQVNLSTVFQI